jgi:hypothetical protein
MDLPKRCEDPGLPGLRIVRTWAAAERVAIRRWACTGADLVHINKQRTSRRLGFARRCRPSCARRASAPSIFHRVPDICAGARSAAGLGCVQAGIAEVRGGLLVTCWKIDAEKPGGIRWSYAAHSS